MPLNSIEDTVPASDRTRAQGRGVAPRVWIVDAYRAGERKQLRALAEMLGWPCEVKELAYRRLEVRTNLFQRSDLHGVDSGRSSPLEPPWPDLVISAGMRNEPVCRWIRQQTGGRARIVFIGRVWADPRHFDLVITTPQYPVPPRSNVLCNDLPLHLIDRDRLEAARQEWAPQVSHLPRPYITLNMGGDSGPYAFGEKTARRLARAATELASERGGSLLVTSSARTRASAIDAFERQRQQVPMYLYRWREADPGNPYQGFLALADELIVTADSIAMLSEACATGRPVHMFDLATGRLSMRRDMHRAMGRREPLPGVPDWRQDSGGTDWSLPALAYRALMRWGWRHLSRDISRVHAQLVASGRTHWLGGRPIAIDDTDAVGDDGERAVSRIQELLADPG